MSVILLDLDHFKRYNDAHGHIAGDQMLRECAQSWSAHLREHDLLGRFGGEEFAAVLPDCASDEAAVLADRLRDVTPPGQSCSAGVATLDRGESSRTLLQRADAALYRAKAAGRDATVVATAPGPFELAVS